MARVVVFCQIGAMRIQDNHPHIERMLSHQNVSPFLTDSGKLRLITGSQPLNIYVLLQVSLEKGTFSFHPHKCSPQWCSYGKNIAEILALT